MYKFIKTISGMAAVAGFAALIVLETVPCARAQAGQTTPTKRNYKDNGEYELYTAAYKDVQNPAKQIEDLETWARKYPESDYKDVRTGMLVGAYSAVNPPQPAKVLEYGAQLLAKDLKTVFDDPQDGKRQALTFLYQVTNAAASLTDPTPAQLATGKNAAQQLKELAAAFFVAANKPAAMAQADWDKTRAVLDQAADHMKLVAIILPAEKVLAKSPKVSAECRDIAEPAYKQALAEFPENSYVSYKLGQAFQCQQKETVDKVFAALYEYQRAAVIDPKLGGAQQDPKVVPAYADRQYANIHGSDEGLADLKELVKKSPLPPDGFKIKTAHEIAEEKQAEFEKSNPELAMWLRSKSALTDPADPDYFEGKLKDTAVPKLKGVVVDGACKAKEITVAFPTPGATGALTAEAKLKFEAPLTGKPEPNTEITFDGGVPSAFSKDPFLLTLDIEKAKVEGLKLTPCTVTPAKKAAPAAAPAAKKKQ